MVCVSEQPWGFICFSSWTFYMTSGTKGVTAVSLRVCACAAGAPRWPCLPASLATWAFSPECSSVLHVCVCARVCSPVPHEVLSVRGLLSLSLHC